jgi:hypothetical protein
MMSWDAFTWLAIAILIFGSVAVFAWFLTEALRLLRQFQRRPPADVTDHPDAAFPGDRPARTDGSPS